MNHTRMGYIALFCFLTLELHEQTCWSEERVPPNIVFIMADDLGWKDVSYAGSTFYETPNIDRFVASGIQFSDYYVANPLCSPTRASVITGQYPGRIGITSPTCHLPELVLEKQFAKAGPGTRVLIPKSLTRLRTEYYTLAEALQDAGYVTAHFGKWHLGKTPYSALQHGFDTDVPNYHGPGPAGSYLAPWRFGKPFQQRKPREHIEDRMANEAVAWLKAHSNQPFFLNYWPFSVHAPYNQLRDVKPRKLAKYAAKSDSTLPQHHPVMGGMVESLDEAVGKVLRTLDELELSDNTIVIFTSDNGGVHWSSGVENRQKADWGFNDVPITSNSPLRGGKATIYEGGVRVPCAVRWPGVTQPGTKSDALAMSIDWFPTILDMLGIETKQDVLVDGVSLRPAFTGDNQPRNEVFVHFPHGQGIRPGFQPSSSLRVGDFKLIRFYCDNDDFSDRHELYNLREDISEADDLSSSRPDVVRSLSQRLDQLLLESESLIPKRNPQWKKRAKTPKARQKATAS